MIQISGYIGCFNYYETITYSVGKTMPTEHGTILKGK